MLRYAIQRLLIAIPTLFVVITISFFLIRVAPGGPFDLERPLEAQVMENLLRVYQLDKPVWQQYLIYLQNLAKGDLGPSYYFRDFTVLELFGRGLPVSMLLGFWALVLALGIGIPLGCIAALRQNDKADFAVMAIATLGITIPNFVVAPLLTLLLAVQFDLLPAGGWGGGFEDMVLPVVTLALPQIAIIARMTRASMIEALRSHHVRTARSNGLPTRIVVGVHALRGALLPVVSYLGPAAAALLTGSVVVETIFGIPGVGRYFVQAALNRDYTLVMGAVILIAVFVILFNLVVDLAYAAIDPRVRATTQVET